MGTEICLFFLLRKSDLGKQKRTIKPRFRCDHDAVVKVTCGQNVTIYTILSISHLDNAVMMIPRRRRFYLSFLLVFVLTNRYG